MKKLKRALASILTVALLASSVNVGFAATANFSDVDSKYSTAVTRLASIDILAGYEDGTFKPEGTITRAEAAAVMVRMLGKEKLASYSAGVSQFSDMTASHWANGYVNVAASAGLVKGYEDGTFGPEKQVTYAEMVTMMVRALGAGEAVGSAGTWPNNYLNFALVEGLTDDVAVVPGAPAVRGDVAIMANKTLDTQMWVATGYNTDGTRTYAKSAEKDKDGKIIDKTLFSEKLELTKYDMYTVDSSLKNDDETYSFVASKTGDLNHSFTFAEGLQTSVLPGTEVDIWENKDSDVVSVQLSNDSKQKLVNFADVTANSSTKVTVKLADGSTKTYNYATGAAAIVDGVGGAVTTIDKDNQLVGKAILDKDGKVAKIYVYTYKNAFVVDSVKYYDTDKKYVVKADTDLKNSDASATYQLGNTDVVYVNGPTGATLSLADVKEGDMFMYCGANKEYVMVFPAKTVEGTIDSTDAETISIDGKDYSYNDVIGTNLADTVSVDDTVKAYLDMFGNIAILDKVNGGETSGEYGIITDFYAYADASSKNKVTAKINMFDLASGVESGLKTFDAKETDVDGALSKDFYDETSDTVKAQGLDADGTDNVAGNADDQVNYASLVGKVVKYEVNSDKTTIYDIASEEVAVLTGKTVDVDREKFDSYYVDSSNVKVYQATTPDSDGIMDVKTIAWNNLKDQITTPVDYTLVSFDNDKEVADYVYFNNAADNILKSNNNTIGVVTGVKALTGGEYKVSVATIDGSSSFYVKKDDASSIKGTAFDTNQYAVNSASNSKLVGLLVTFTADADGYVAKDTVTFSNAIQTGKFYEVTDRNIVKLLDTNDGSSTEPSFDKFDGMFTVEADVTKTVTAAKATLAAFNGVTITAPANGSVYNGYKLTIVNSNLGNTLAINNTTKVITLTVDTTAAVDANTLTATITGTSPADGDFTIAGVATAAGTSAATAGGIDAAIFALKNIAVSDVNSIVETDKDTTKFVDANTEEYSTVYYYLVKVDEDGKLDSLGATQDVAIMVYDPNEFNN